MIGWSKSQGRFHKESIIQGTPSLIFISYRRADSESVVGRIHSELKKHFPAQDVFLDHYSIPLGKPFLDVIRERLAASKFAIVLIGPNWHSIADEKTGHRRLDDPNDFVRLEVETALATPWIDVIPLWVMRASSSAEEIAKLHDSLRPLFRLNGMSIRPVPDEERDIQRLIGRIASQLESGTTTDSPFFAGRMFNPNSKSSFRLGKNLSSQDHLAGDSNSIRRHTVPRTPTKPPYFGVSSPIIGIDFGTTVTEPQLLRVREPEPLRLTLVNLGCLGDWSFLSLDQLL